MFKEIPDIDSIIMAPLTVKVPTNPSVLYALSCALARKSTQDNFSAITTYVDRMPSEFNLLSIQNAQILHPEVAKTHAFIDWAQRNQNVLQ